MLTQIDREWAHLGRRHPRLAALLESVREGKCVEVGGVNAD